MVDDIYQYNSFRFEIEIGGQVVAEFIEVTGIDVVADIVYREGKISKSQPSLMKYVNITLKRGLIKVNSFYEWIDGVREGKIEKRIFQSI